MSDVVTSLLIKVFVILIIGIWGNRKGIMNKEVTQKLSTFLIDLVLPISILVSSQKLFSKDNLVGMGESALIAASYYLVTILFCLALAKRLKMSETKGVIFVDLAVFANVGFLGFSLVPELLGDTGTLYTVMHNSVFQMLFFTYGIARMRGEKITVKTVLNNKILWISIVTIVLYFLPVRIPSVVLEPFSLVGGMMMPISMLIIGAQIGEMEILDVIKNKQALLVDVLRMFAFPAVMFIVLKLLHVESEVAITAFIMSALPSGSLNVVMAEEYQCEPELATIAVAQNMLIMIVTLPIVLVLCGWM